MYKLALTVMALGIGAAVMAQTPAQVKKDQEKKTEMKDLRSDVRDHKAAKHVENRDLAHIKVKKAIHDHKAVARINKDQRSDSKRLKAQGVDHSIAKAKRQVKVQDDNRKDHTQ